MTKAARMEQRRRGFKSEARKLLAMCSSGVLLLSIGQAAAEYLREGTLQRNLQYLSGGSTQSTPVFQDQIATCNLTDASSRVEGETTPRLTLSKENLTATLQCYGQNNEKVPNNIEKVCSATVAAATVATCKSPATAAQQQVTLQSLLGSSQHIVWHKSKVTPEELKEGEEWTLQLQESDLPLTDKAFFVGCDVKANPTEVKSPSTECKVDVNVKARPSFVADNNVVTCAYGGESNPKTLEVQMTTEKNTFTIQCGSEGSINPPTYVTEYCDPSGEVSKCTQKKFEGILPAFVESWWKSAEENRSTTLTIPVTDFPESQQQFRVGCVYKREGTFGFNSPGKTGDNVNAPTNATTSNCNVVVTLMPGSSASSYDHMVTTIAGAAALMGLLIGFV
ncbi:SAG-related sequence SRS40A [Toxoplasma gondii FOU]|uniref:SAG-related sequence SRS40A n=3 Tax=Toxoplasma gondii TaxID=5811 RepID=A0A086LEF7_TOXGO|nr:SAG-related sequence SRS40A [Toxoplasma gondii FOU]PUA91317.1 SAG-related sequence SRS40A [Toxoplasma gondii TgCATBr9]RQX74672.1 SAG-related sequence SRS40A [Toxoplasma gondii CAST]